MCDWIGISRDVFASLCLTAESVLGTEKRDQVDRGMLVKKLNAAAQLAIDAAGTSHQRRPCARNQVKPLFEKYFQS